VRIALDTNVLVRYLTWDHDVQSPLSAEAIEGAETVVVSSIVLCETVWVLERAYKLKAKEIAMTLKDFIVSETVEVDRPLAEAGLTALERGGDFADGVILFEADRAKADQLVTFDQQFSKLAKSPRLNLLGAD
jgi:predicted nucleic-acid-binding protein